MSPSFPKANCCKREAGRLGREFRMKAVGVLALQGDFEAHRKSIELAGGRTVEGRTASDLEQCDGLIIPGGESTTMLKLIEQEGLTAPLQRFAEQKPIYASCSGAIVKTREVTQPPQPSFALTHITGRRHGSGAHLYRRIRQLRCA